MTLCKCGCGQEIIIKERHFWKGHKIPKYIHGHNNGYKFIFPNLCECGCNEIIWGRNNYIKGHNRKNIKLSNEILEKISKSLKGRKVWNKGLKGAQEAWNKGKKELRLEVIKKISKSRKGKCCGKDNPLWKGGIAYFPYCPKFNKDKREEIREKYNRRCFICNKDEKENIINNKLENLCVHHIDRDKEQGCNNKEWKLIPLCRSCHAKIHNNNEMYNKIINIFDEMKN